MLDDTQVSDDGSHDIHGHGYLDAARWAWLKDELDAGQANHQLMIVAAHVPIAVAPIGSEVEWWGETKGIAPDKRNAVALAELIDKLRATPNLLMWIAGHRHVNAVKAFASDDPSKPERGFWQVETSSLRDFPQQFRTFDLYLNDDDTDLDRHAQCRSGGRRRKPGGEVAPLRDRRAADRAERCSPQRAQRQRACWPSAADDGSFAAAERRTRPDHPVHRPRRRDAAGSL